MMQIYEYAKTSKLPLKTLKLIVKRGVIHETLTNDDLKVLAACENLWGCWEYLRPQFSKYNQEERQLLITHVDFTKWERWAYTRMINVPQGEKIIMKKIVAELEYAFLIKLEPGQIKRIYKVREKLYNDRKATKKTAQSINESLPYNEQIPNMKDGCE